jgi:hypothetical protein
MDFAPATGVPREELAELFERGLLQVDGPLPAWDDDPWAEWDGIRWTLADDDTRPAA